MSTTIDQRVVEMRFDNKNFESNVSTSMSTLERLKHSLKLDGATKGLENLGDAAKKVDVTGLGSSVETVKERFSALEVMGVTALANITNSAVNAGKRILHSLTLEPIMSGFQEYETQMNAVQTILANTSSKGTTIDQVNEALDTLNLYADKTIYNFTEMTRNIGTFTAAGVDLETSVSAIQGIANLAAVSGSTSQQASTAMYQLSQALASGSVKLMDWNSVVNAGMGGEVFQNALMKTAWALENSGASFEEWKATVVDGAGSFRDSLKSEWITAEVLTKTLSQFTMAAEEGTAQWEAYKKSLMDQGFSAKDAEEILKMANTATDAATKVKTFTQLMDTTKEAIQSGWSQSFKIIIGDFEEAKEIFSAASDYIGAFVSKVSDARNLMLKKAMASPWERLTEKINDSGVATDDFKKALIETAKEHGVNVAAMINDQTTFEDTLKNGWLTKDIVIETLKKMSSGASDAAKSTEDLNAKLKYFQKVVDEVWHGDYDNGKPRIQLLTEAGYNYAEVQALVNKTIDGHRLTLEDLNETQLKSIGYTNEEIAAIKALAEEAEKSGTSLNKLIDNLERPSGKELLLQSLANIGKTILGTFEAIGDAYQNIFPPEDQAQTLYNFLDGFARLTETFALTDEKAEKLRRTFEGLFAILDIITTITGGVFKFAFEVLLGVLNLTDLSILDLTASVGDIIVAFRDWIDEHNFLKDAASGVAELIVKMGKSFGKIGGYVEKSVKAIRRWIGEFLEIPAVKKTVETVEKTVGKVVGKVKQHFGGAVEVIKEFFNNIDSLTLEDVKNGFIRLGETIKTNIIDPLGSKAQDLIGKFKDKLSGIFTGLKLPTDFNVLDILKAFKDKVVEIFTGIRDKSGEAINGFKENVEVGFNKVGDFFEALKEKAKALLDWLKEFFNIDLGDIIAVGIGVGVFQLARSLDNIADLINRPFDILETIADAYADKAKAQAFNESANGIIKIAIAIGILAFSVSLLSNIDWQTLLISSGILIGLGGALLGLSFAFDKLVKGSGFATSALAISAGLLILVIALEKITNLTKNADNIAASLAELALLAVALVGVSAILGRIGGGTIGSSFGIAISLVAFVLAIKGVVDALEDISKLTVTVDDVLVLGGIMGALAIVMASVRNTASIGTALSFIAIPIAIKMMIGVIDDICGLDLFKIQRNIDAFAFVIGGIAGLMLSTQLAGDNASKAGIAILEISVAIRLLIPAIEALGEMEENKLQRGLTAVTLLEAIFAVIIGVSHFAGQSSAKAGLMLLEMSVALLIITGVMAILTKLDPDGLDRALLVVATLEIIFGALIGLSAFAGQVQGLKGTLITLTVAVALLALSIAGLSLIDEDKVLKASEAMSLVMGALATLVASTKYAGKATGTLLTIAGVMVILGAILVAMSLLDVEASIQNATALGILMTALSASLYIISQTKTLPKGAVGALYSITPVLAIVAVIIGLLGYCQSKYNISTSVETVFALSTLLIALSAAVVILGTVPNVSTDAMLALYVVAGALGIVAVILSELARLNVEPSIETALSLSILLGAMSGVTVLLATLGKGGGATVGYAALGAAALVAVVGIIGAMMYGLGACMEYVPRCEEFLDKGIVVLQKIGKGLGDLVGYLIGGVIEGISSAFPALASGLSGFMDNMEPVFESLRKVDKSALEGAANLVAIMVCIGAAELANAITSGMSWLFGELGVGSIADTLVPFGEAMVSFSDTVSGKIDSEAVNAAANAGKILVSLATSLPKEGGLLQEFLGTHISLETFGEDLKKFGTAIVDFSNTITSNGGIDSEAVESAANAGLLLSELANSLPKEGGVWQDWFGTTINLDDFGEDLKAFGEAIVGFSNTVSAEGAINSTAIEAAANAGTLMSELANSLPSYGGKIQQWFMGEKVDFEKFGQQMISFGKALITYSSGMSTPGAINKDAIQASADAASILVKLSESLPEYDGAIASWFGSNQINLEDFGGQLIKFGEGLKGYSEAVSGVDSEAVANTATAALALATLSNALPTKQAFDGKVTLSKFGGDLSDFGEDFYDFYEDISGVSDVTKLGDLVGIVGRLADMAVKVNGIDSSKLPTFAENLNKLSNIGVGSFIEAFADTDITRLQDAMRIVYNLAIMAADMVNYDMSGMNKFTTALQSLGKVSLTKFIDEFNGSAAKSRVASAVTGFISNLTSTVDSYKDDVSQTFANLVSISANIMLSEKSKFAIVGETIMSEFISGIKSKADPIYEAVSLLAYNAYNKVNGYQDDFYVSGKTVMVGLIEGAKTKADIFTTTITDMLDAVVSTMNGYQTDFYEAACDLISNAVEGLDGYWDAYTSGTNFATGFADGIEDTAWAAGVAAEAMANAAKDAAKEALKENSPSKEMYDIGEYGGIGFVNALIDKIGDSERAGEDVANASVSGMKDAINKISDVVNGEINANPTIRPLVDMTEVDKGLRQIDAAFSREQAMSISGMRSSATNSTIQNGEKSTRSEGNSYSFVQNNYSPKALSRTEIYRQTNNQFSAFERRGKK